MPIPPINAKRKKYDMTKEQLIEWMHNHGWTYGDEKLVQPFISLPSRGPHAGQIVLENLVYVPRKFSCPNIRHGTSDWVFLRLMSTGVFLTCIHRNCRITTGPIARDLPAVGKRRKKVITLEEALEIEKSTQQVGLSKFLEDYAESHGVFLD